MRGARHRCRPGRPEPRIIPADAGSTTLYRKSRRTPRDHPRGCGEHSQTTLMKIQTKGSSPRMRGARTALCRVVPLLRIIPADAGSTPSFSWDLSISEDHPRGCGEHRQSLTSLLHDIGSSPRMRGAHLPLMHPQILVGIIPADAGSTADLLGRDVALEDHPRGCGEHTTLSDSRQSNQGSSPRMRGAPMPQRVSLQ